MKSGKCLIISGGELDNSLFYQGLAHQMDCIIAADGGARHASMIGVLPHFAIGDFDTLSPAEVEELKEKGSVLEHYPPDKDYSDTHLALLKAIQLGYTDITMIAALGGRIDHSLANIMLLALPEAKNIKLRILTEHQELLLIDHQLKIKEKQGTLISLLPLSEKVTGITTEGLLYKVPEQNFVMGNPNGISNVMTGTEAYIKVEQGLLLAIITQSEGE